MTTVVLALTERGFVNLHFNARPTNPVVFGNNIDVIGIEELANVPAEHAPDAPLVLNDRRRTPLKLRLNRLQVGTTSK